ncbi:twin-arginine translocase subunit TatC [Anaeroselena agilis]|uniref:Sec-independent protein translocase protein TatC n=1 Tax=Anaeroselena agilis TaxID=3063788 RepID=A0ABU3NZU1_9FIRM|nr:twin-arginine translocase subunit TatC [Selenomonadales bacterium 4137-cl]
MSDTPREVDTEQEERGSGEMSLVDHLQELRKRLIVCVVVVLAASFACYYFATDLVHIITAPAGKLYYMNPAEAFFTYLKVSFFAGFLLSLPVVFYQLWAFVVPALTNQERQASLFLVPASLVLFFVGLAFSYFLVLPAAISFFIGFATEDLQPMFSIGQYLSFVISFMLPFGFVFELPLFIIVAAKLGVISSGFLAAKRKIVIVLAFVVGAVVSPTPDVFSQTMIAVPLMVLYEISVFIVRHVLRR